jgi:hypothetical protein
MKQFTLSILILLGFSQYSSSQQLQIYGRYTLGGKKVIPDINYYGTKDLPKGFGISYFLLVEQGWAEAYVGPTYSPKPWIQIGLSAGIEQNKPLFRGAGSLWLGKDNISFLFLWEKGFGKDNYWYKATLSCQVHPSFSIGMCAWRFHGLGPIVTYEIPKSDIKLWVMPAYDLENKDYYTNTRLVFGMNLNPKAIMEKIAKLHNK